MYTILKLDPKPHYATIGESTKFVHVVHSVSFFPFSRERTAQCSSQEMVDTSVPDGSFPLPALTLKRSGGVLDEAIAIIRNDRAALYGQPGRVFSPEEMASLC